MKHELWLEYGFRQSDGWNDVLWYNEGRASEIGYFVKGFFKRIFRGYKTKMYYKIRYGKIKVEFAL
jgi:hypothetical protein